MMIQMCLDPDLFVAGGLNLVAEVWKEYFKLTRNKGEMAGRVACWMSREYRLEFVGSGAKGQEWAPQREKKIEIVRKMVTRVVGEGKVVELMQGREPHAIQFPNHESAKTYESFVDEELEKALSQKVVVKWPEGSRPKLWTGCGWSMRNGKNLGFVSTPCMSTRL